MLTTRSTKKKTMLQCEDNIQTCKDTAGRHKHADIQATHEAKGYTTIAADTESCTTQLGHDDMQTADGSQSG